LASVLHVLTSAHEPFSSSLRKERMLTTRLLVIVLLGVFFAQLVAALAASSADDVVPLPLYQRFNPAQPRPKANTRKEDCHAGALCAGPGRMYPIGQQPGVKFYSQFTVPPLPEDFSIVDTTYYDYFNIFWRANPVGGLMNQFVPQLMLGNALANSTNFPHYDPIWIELDQWHIGAQYFMGLCVPNASFPDGFDCNRDQPFVAKAATGDLIKVNPGEVVETSFELLHVRNRVEWELRIGVMGTGRFSVVLADTPFMGLVNSTKSWMEDTYAEVYVGSCLENYGMESPRNYPKTWEILIEVLGHDSNKANVSMWNQWHMDHDRDCLWQPRSSVQSRSGGYWQRAIWNATLSSISSIDTA